jgi:hypothetical protein
LGLELQKKMSHYSNYADYGNADLKAPEGQEADPIIEGDISFESGDY